MGSHLGKASYECLSPTGSKTRHPADAQSGSPFPHTQSDPDTATARQKAAACLGSVCNIVPWVILAIHGQSPPPARHESPGQGGVRPREHVNLGGSPSAVSSSLCAGAPVPLLSLRRYQSGT